MIQRIFTLESLQRKNLPLGCHVWPGYKCCLVPSLEASLGCQTNALASSLRRWQPPVCSVWNAKSTSVPDKWCSRLPPLICRPFVTRLLQFSVRSTNLHKRAQYPRCVYIFTSAHNNNNNNNNNSSIRSSNNNNNSDSQPSVASNAL